MTVLYKKKFKKCLVCTVGLGNVYEANSEKQLVKIKKFLTSIGYKRLLIYERKK